MASRKRERVPLPRGPPPPRPPPPRAHRQGSRDQSAVPDWLKAALLAKKEEKEKNKQIADAKKLKAQVERQRESAGVAEKAKEDEESIPGVTFEGVEATPKFDYKTWAADLDEVAREVMDAVLKKQGVESLELRDLGKKDTVAVLKEVCPEKSIRTSVRKSILALYSKINRYRSLELRKRQAAERMEAESRKRAKIEEDASSRSAQSRRGRQILEAFARNREGKGKMVKHKFSAKRLPKLFS
ncbi:hypothetical protein AAMO2058_000723600 [Amorphochlora amoebiformis]|eukprot:613198-Amorphochlora_amoeboformis.AAC.2